VGGNEYLIENEVSGLLVPPQDVSSLAAGMRRLAESAPLRQEYGKAAFRKFQEQFEIRRMFEAYEKIYRVSMHRQV
jgi:glycosyltransferase involved in cell wall biosynthesis